MTQDERPGDARSQWDSLALLFGGVLTLGIFHAVGRYFTGNHDLGLGFLIAPSPAHARFLALWTFFGSLAIGLFSVAIFRLTRERRTAPIGETSNGERWLLYGSLLALVLPCGLRMFLLLGAPLADDESAYRLSAEILASGRLYIDSHPEKLFFDNRFLINDGKFYTQYFLGWPALLVPGVWLGMPGFINAFYSAFTVPPLFFLARHFGGVRCAAYAVVLYLVSPFLMIGAATELSHTSCIMTLAWLTWCCHRARQPDASNGTHAAVALLFSTAFFIRPVSAIAVGAPLLVWWLIGVSHLPRAKRVPAFAAFALPAAVMGGLFLFVNHAQTGSFFEVAYERAYTYARQNSFRFSAWPADRGDFTPNLHFSDPLRALAILGAGVFRFNYALLGWPCSFLFIFFAGTRGFSGVLWLMIAAFAATHGWLNDVGIDTFGPVHFSELALPVILLSAFGIERLSSLLRRAESVFPDAGPLRNFPIALLVALIIASAAGYLPIKLAAIRQIAANINHPMQALHRSGVRNAVIFVDEPFVHYCLIDPSHGWVFARPKNDPELQNDVLWVNHLSVERDKSLLRRFPGRQGYIMHWTDQCEVRYLPLEQLSASGYPDSPVLR